MIGTAVAAFDGETNTWLRAEVIDVEKDSLTIEFVDYGTTLDGVTLSPSEIRWLDSTYLLEPKKCLKVGLYGVVASSSTKVCTLKKAYFPNSTSARRSGQLGKSNFLQMERVHWQQDLHGHSLKEEIHKWFNGRQNTQRRPRCQHQL